MTSEEGAAQRPVPPEAAGGVSASPRRRGLLHRLLRVVLVMGIVVLMLRVTSLVESLVFYMPSRAAFANPRGFEDVWFTSSDGTRLHGWFMRAADAAPGEVRPAILHCHGNAGNVDSHVDFSRFLTHAGFHVFIFDYRGYGRSDAARLPRRATLLRDSCAAFDVLGARADVDAKRIGVYGVSLGAVFALAVAGEREQVASVCTVSAFSSWSGVASDHFPVLGGLLIPRGLDPKRLAPKLGTRPYLIVHGTNDEIIDVRHAGVLEAAAKEAGVGVRVARIDGADHNGIANYEESREAVRAFYLETLGGRVHQP